MAIVNFDLDPVNGMNQFSAPLVLAAGELARARFTSISKLNEFSFEVTTNGVTTTEQVDERNSFFFCNILGPASVRLAVSFHAGATRHAIGILEGQ